MKNRRLARFAFCSLFAVLPSFLSAALWDANRPRPSGFQRTLGYLADDFYNYPNADLQTIRNNLLTQDNVTGIVAALKNSGLPPSGWEAEAQKTHDVWAAQYEQVKTTLRQTKTNAEGIIQAVEGNQPLSAELVADPGVRALIAGRWRLINLGEQVYQALLYMGLHPGGNTGAGRPPARPQDLVPPKPAKSQSQIDWERTRETWRRAIERRRAFEARLAEKNRKRLREILELTRYLQNHGAVSTNKFQARRPGASSGGSANLAEPDREPPPDESFPAAPETTEPATEEAAGPDESLDYIEELQRTMVEQANRIAAEGGEKPEITKVKVYRGILMLRRDPTWTDEIWPTIKKAYIDRYAQSPDLSGMEDQGDTVTWHYKSLTLPVGGEQIKVIPDGEPTDEEMPGQKPTAKAPKPEGNGDATPNDDTVVPGTEEKPVVENPKTKPATKPVAKAAPPPKPEEEAKDVPGYWYDPTDKSRKETVKFIYVRVDGVAERVTLKEARAYGVPATATIETMTWYNESTGEIVKNGHLATHLGSNQPKSTNKFAKPKP